MKKMVIQNFLNRTHDATSQFSNQIDVAATSLGSLRSHWLTVVDWGQTLKLIAKSRSLTFYFMACTVYVYGPYSTQQSWVANMYTKSTPSVWRWDGEGRAGYPTSYTPMLRNWSCSHLDAFRNFMWDWIRRCICVFRCSSVDNLSLSIIWLP